MQRHFRLSVIVTGATSLPSLGHRHWCNVTSVSRSSSLVIRHFRLSVIVTAHGSITMHGATPFSVSPVVSGATLCSSSLGHSVSDAVHLFGLQSVEQWIRVAGSCSVVQIWRLCDTISGENPMPFYQCQLCNSIIFRSPSLTQLCRPSVTVRCAMLSSLTRRRVSLDHLQWCKSGNSAIPSVVQIHI